MATLIIDNYDSFTFNLYQLIGEITGIEPLVIKNDAAEWEDLLHLDFDSVVISPGPGRPDNDRDFGLSRRVILELDVPTLGVCLGHQGICHFFGGAVRHAPEPMHGRLSRVHHDASGLFANVPNPFWAVRYHSLACEEPLPACLTGTAWSEDGVLMGLAHRTKPLWGVQFHPESICTEYGKVLLQNFAALAARWRRRAGRGEQTSQKTWCTVRGPANARTLPEVKSPEQQNLFVRRVRASADSARLFVGTFAREHAAFWLDSNFRSEGASRFSFIGGASADEAEIVRYYAQERRLVVTRGADVEVSDENIFSYLKRVIPTRAAPPIDLPFDFNCGYIGYFGYELKAACGAAAVHRSPHPDCLLLFVDRCVVVDHEKGELYMLYLGWPSDERKAAEWFEWVAASIDAPDAYSAQASACAAVNFKMAQRRDLYLRHIDECLKHIRDGESYEVCLTNKLRAETSVNPLQFYLTLRGLSPAPYSAYLHFPEVAVACSSPERFLRVRPDGFVETKPIKGTIRRGVDTTEDERLRHELANDEKTRAENLMIVDLLRNDLGTVCGFGTVSVPKLMNVETYATLHQLVSTITGRLQKGRSAVDCLRMAFPGGSMTGAPKQRTMEIIDALESEARGIYSGSIGYLALNGSADLNIVIRTAVFSQQRVSIGVGGAIVSMSDPADEWDEIILKAKALLHAFEKISGKPVALDF